MKLVICGCGVFLFFFQASTFFSQMDPNVPHSFMTGVPFLGRGRAQQPQELALGRSRVLPAPTEEPRVGVARGFLPSDNTLPGRGVTLPVSQTMFGRGRGLVSQPDVGVIAGRARGLLLPAPEPKVHLARGAILSSLGTARGSEATAQDPTKTLSTKEVWIVICIARYIGYTSGFGLSSFVFSKVDAPDSAGTLVGMMRGIGVDASRATWGRGNIPLGLCQTCFISPTTNNLSSLKDCNTGCVSVTAIITKI